jgi:hypothetical protein
VIGKQYSVNSIQYSVFSIQSIFLTTDFWTLLIFFKGVKQSLQDDTV